MTLGTLIYLVVSTEQTIIKNDPEKTTNDWTYGQTIAVILLLQQVMDIASTWVEKRAEKKEQKEEEKQDSEGVNSLEMTTLGANPNRA